MRRKWKFAKVFALRLHCVLINVASFTIRKGMTMRVGIRPAMEIFVELVS